MDEVYAWDEPHFDIAVFNHIDNNDYKAGCAAVVSISLFVTGLFFLFDVFVPGSNGSKAAGSNWHFLRPFFSLVPSCSSLKRYDSQS